MSLASLHTYAVRDYYVVREGVLVYARQRGRFPAGSSSTRGSLCTYNCWIRKYVCLTHVVISGHVAVHSSAACLLAASHTPNEKVPQAGKNKHQPEAQHWRGIVSEHHVLLIRTVLEGSRVRSLPVDPADQICGRTNFLLCCHVGTVLGTVPQFHAAGHAQR